MDGQSFPGQAAGGIQKQAQLPAHLLSRRPAGLEGEGVRQEAAPHCPAPLSSLLLFLLSGCQPHRTIRLETCACRVLLHLASHAVLPWGATVTP